MEKSDYIKKNGKYKEISGEKTQIFNISKLMQAF